MLVLLMIYPVVFLFGAWVDKPLISGWANLPFAAALFIGNVASVISLNYLVPWISSRFAWWLQPADKDRRTTDIAGAALLMALYVALVAAFWLFF
jgi:uncharacterized protein